MGRLNRLLPKRQFVLMGPGRWGSRGDIRLGVPVTYADISNSAILVEIARKKGGYLPDLSFGTHFFQDLVEASIRYLPLYPDDPDVVFNEAFFLRATNALPELAPEFASLSDVLRVIDVPGATDGRVLRVLMNGDLDEAVGFLAQPTVGGRDAGRRPGRSTEPRPDDHWRWRLRMAQRIAAAHRRRPLRREGRVRVRLDEERHRRAGERHRPAAARRGRRRGRAAPALDAWLDGWSQALAEANYLRTGYRTEGLLDVHCVTDDDVARGDSYASKIGAVTDAARPLPLGPER